MSGVVLETERLVLREFREDDLEAYADMLADPETMWFYPRPYTREEARAFMEKNGHRSATTPSDPWGSGAWWPWSVPRTSARQG